MSNTLVPHPAPVAATPVTLAHPTSCPAWCQHRHLPGSHNHTERDTVHRSVSLTLGAPGSGHGEALVRAELFQLDERSDIGEALLYLEGETMFELSGPEADIFIAQAQAFVDALRILRGQLGDERA